MMQASLKLKKYMHGVNALSNTGEKFMLKAVLFAFAALAIWYLLLLATIVFNISERKTAEAKIRTMSSEVSDLELDYLTRSNNIDLTLSYSMGFKEVSPKFATRKSLTSLGANSVPDSVSINLSKNEI